MFRKHVLQILIICLTLIGYCESASTLTGSRRIAESVNFTLICKDNGPITGNVVFFQNTLPRGGCIPNCGSGVSGYTVTQNKTSQTTFLHIGAVSASRDEGNWTCRQGTNTESPSLNLSQIPSFLPSTSISIQPAIETVAVLQNINVSATCSYPAPKITWTYEKENNVITVSSTSTSISASCPGEQVETTNIFQANSLQDSGRIVLSVTVEHDSFDPPDYQVTFSSMEINLGGSTTMASSVVNSTHLNMCLCCDVWYEDYLCLGLVIGGIIMFVVIFIIICVCCCVRWRNGKNPQPKSDTNIRLSNELSPTGQMGVDRQQIM